MGSEWSRQPCQHHITPAFKTFSSGKVNRRRVINIRKIHYKFLGVAEALRLDLQGVGQQCKISGGRSSQGASQRED